MAKSPLEAALQLTYGAMDTQGVVGNASQEQISFVQSRLISAHNNEKLLGVWVPDEQSAHNASYSALYTMAVIPLLWPHLILTGSCLYAYARYRKEVTTHSLYFVTTNGFGSILLDYESSFCCHPGLDYTYHSWDSVQSINVDNKGTCWLQIPSVHIVQYGMHATGVGDDRRLHQNREVWLTNEPDVVADHLRRAFSEFKSRGMSPPVQVVQGAAAQLRVFVSRASSPDDKRIALLDPAASWDEVVAALEQACSVCVTHSAVVRLVPGGGGNPVTVNSVAVLSANDCLLLEA